MIRREKPGLKQELRLIPMWAVIVAACILILMPAFIYFFEFGGSTEAPQPFVILVSVVPAFFLSVMTLMVGYVNKDAGRRGMSRTLWTLIVALVPNAIGFILYFILRNPLKTECPKCNSVVDARVNFCPHCRYNFHPTCPECKAPTSPGDDFCANCGARMGQVA